MKRFYVQGLTIFLVSLILGVLGAVQYNSIDQKNQEFEENNLFREIRILVEGNKELKDKITDLDTEVESLKSKESATKSANETIIQAKSFSGEAFDKDNSLEIIFQGEIEIKDLTEIINVFWNAGAANLMLNGLTFSYNNAGLDQAGGQILLGGTPISEPYLFEVFGNKENLIRILDTNGGALEKFQNDKTQITISEKIGQ